MIQPAEWLRDWRLDSLEQSIELGLKKTTHLGSCGEEIVRRADERLLEKRKFLCFGDEEKAIIECPVGAEERRRGS